MKNRIHTTRKKEKELEVMSPFEIKNTLISLAKKGSPKTHHAYLNAGRGNPNWVATTPREAFFNLGLFGLEECRRTMDYSEGLAGIPQKEGIAKRFESFLEKNASLPGIALLKGLYNYGINIHNFQADAFVHEIVEGVIGNQYPVPDRMLKHPEAIVHDYIIQEMCAGKAPKGKYDIFATEGGTAAMCYIFDSLMQNQLIKKGDKVALFVPVFTPYIEIPELDRYDFEVIHISACRISEDGTHNWQYPEEELEKLKDPNIKVAFLVNPSNPPSFALSDDETNKIVSIIKNDNPNLMFITDDVYGTFVPGFRSLMAEVPHNTLGVYSFSKYFGCTGWRIGVIAIHEDNIFDKMLSELPQEKQAKLNNRYSSINLHPEELKFIDRMVADSRQVALNHTAGLSLPQQIQMMLFAAFALLDKENNYKNLTCDIVNKRLKLLYDGMGFELKPNKNRAGYYNEIDIMVWAKQAYGDEFAKYLEKHYEPVDILFRLAEIESVVLLNGGGFDGPEWSIRVSLANLEDNDYSKIAIAIKEILAEYVENWKN
jgi:aspartate 4-decarboxylase